MSLTELEALTILSGAPSLGSIKIKQLIQSFGSALDAIENVCDWGHLTSFKNYPISKWKTWYEEGKWLENLELVHRLQVKIISYNDPIYPQRLLEIPDHPLLLYLKGTLLEGDQNNVAIVGTRNASIYGVEMAEMISADLANMGFTIVSGLARGIDTYAHKGALKFGRTIAVIGSGLANIYPRENYNLATEIINAGSIISEFPMNTPPDRQNFPQRNRIVSGLSQASILIEAPIKSGAMNTMDRAFSQNRKLFAIPGRADQENFQGNLLLLKKNKAQLVQSAQDVAYHINNSYNYVESKKKIKILLDNNEENFLSLLPKEELSIDKIEHLSRLPIQEINVLLISLLLKNAIKEYPGKIYKRLI